MSTSTAQEQGEQLRTVSLSIGGMTCASCVARVEKKLNKLDGVSASVNLATESARVTAPSAVSVDDLLATVARAGYTGALLDTASPDESAQSEASPAGEPESTTPAAQASGPSVPGSAGGGRGTKGTGGRATLSMAAPSAAAGRQATHSSTAGTGDASPRSASGSGAKSLGASHMERAADLRLRLIYCLILSVPIMAISMVPALQLPGWQWTVALMALPVAVWGAWPFHKAAFRALRHGAFTMDTLVSLGVIAATGWSLWALIWGGAGHTGMRMTMELMPRHQGHAAHIQLAHPFSQDLPVPGQGVGAFFLGLVAAAKADQVRRNHAAARRQPLGGHVPPQVAPDGRAVQAQPGDGRVARAFVHVAQAQAAQGGQAAFGMARPGVIGQMGKARGRRAQRVLPQGGGVDAARPEKAVQRSGAFARQHAASDLRLMVERGLGKQVEQRTGRARFGVGRAKNHARQPRVQHGPGAHGARLQRHIGRGALRALASGLRGAQRHDFCVGAACALGAAFADDAAIGGRQHAANAGIGVGVIGSLPAQSQGAIHVGHGVKLSGCLRQLRRSLPGGTRTPDLLLRRQLLYPVELRADEKNGPAKR